MVPVEVQRHRHIRLLLPVRLLLLRQPPSVQRLPKGLPQGGARRAARGSPREGAFVQVERFEEELVDHAQQHHIERVPVAQVQGFDEKVRAVGGEREPGVQEGAAAGCPGEQQRFQLHEGFRAVERPDVRVAVLNFVVNLF